MDCDRSSKWVAACGIDSKIWQAFVLAAPAPLPAIPVPLLPDRPGIRVEPARHNGPRADTRLVREPAQARSSVSFRECHRRRHSLPRGGSDQSRPPKSTRYRVRARPARDPHITPPARPLVPASDLEGLAGGSPDADDSSLIGAGCPSAGHLRMVRADWAVP